MSWSKRIFDLAFGLILLLIALPLCAIAAALIKLEDGGPVLFRQTRIGLGGSSFTCYKFRSMIEGAELMCASLSHLNESDGALFKIRHDPRLTFIGRRIRRWSIDEIPQLVNVIRGDMSLVGPRPPLPTEVSGYGRDAYRRLAVRPGMTGLWQVSGRASLSWNETVRLDTYYVDNWSLTQDIAILARTISAVLRTNGAS